MTNILLLEESGSKYHQEGLVDPRKIQLVGHDLKKTHNFNRPSTIKQLCSAFSRENIVLYGLITGEEAVSQDQTIGNVRIPVINIDQLRENISKTISSSEARKIGYIHVSTVQILLKSTFALGISAPITLELSDDRMIDRDNSIIAIGHGDLAFGKLKFDVNYQVGMSLQDSHLERSITLRYQLKGKQLMRMGNHPFTVTYRVNYALTNSHHSLSFKPGDKIEIDSLFEPLVHFDLPQRSFNLTSRNFTSRIQIDSDHSIAESCDSPTFKLEGINNPLHSNILIEKSKDEISQKMAKELGITI